MNSAKTTGNPAVNHQELLDRVDNDRELLHELISIFKEEFPGNLQKLHIAVTSGNLMEVANLSHTLKGTLSNLAVTAGAACAAELEQAARSGDPSRVRTAFSVFDKAVGGLLAEFDACLAEVHPS